MSKGIDISKHNGNIDWGIVKAGGIDFAVIRSGLSTSADAKFKVNAEGAAAHGIPFGVYHFSYSLTPAQAVAEADFCASLIKPYKLYLPVFFDFEYDTERYAMEKGVAYTKENRTAIHKAFCDRIRAHGYMAGIYTNGDYIVNKLNWHELKGYNLWLAQWPKGESTIVSFDQYNPLSVNTKYGKPVIWQFGLGRLDGMTGNVDVDFGYMDFPTIAAPASPKPVATFKPGDKVAVLNTFVSGGRKKARVYNGLLAFTVYHDSYDVISVSGKRVVIGKGKTATAAVHCDNLKKI